MRIYIYIFTFIGVPGGSVLKNPPANAGDVPSIPGSRRSPEGGNGNQLQYSCLGNPMNRGAWWATIHQVTEESDTTEATWWQVGNPISRSQVQGLVPGHGCRAPHQCHLWNWPSLIVTTAKSSPTLILSNQLTWQKYLPWWSPYSALTNHLMPRFQQAFSLSWDYKIWLRAHEERWLSHEPVCCSNVSPALVTSTLPSGGSPWSVRSACSIRVGSLLCS